MQLERTVDEKGRYLGAFDKKEEAEEYIEEKVRSYLFTPVPKRTTVRSICREAQEEGVNLYPNTFGNELKRRGIKIRNSRPRKSTMEAKTFTIEEDIIDQLEEYPKGERSFLARLGLRLVMGLPTPHVIMFLPEEEGQTTMLFKREDQNRIQMFLSGEIDMKFEQQIKKLLTRAEKRGMEAITQYAEQNGYVYYGGTAG